MQADNRVQLLALCEEPVPMIGEERGIREWCTNERDRMASLARQSTRLTHHRVNIMKWSDAAGNKPIGVLAAPCVDVPVVVCPNHLGRLIGVAVGENGEQGAAEGR